MATAIYVRRTGSDEVVLGTIKPKEEEARTSAITRRSGVWILNGDPKNFRPRLTVGELRAQGGFELGSEAPTATE